MEDTPIKTFIFFDLETTGLPHIESGPTRITEIALVAASREHIMDKHEGVSKENNENNDYLPRVLNKMNFTIYPCKMIQPMASILSGLTNENLVEQKPFDDSLFDIVTLFMERMEKPICLIAHNGYRFDFPILQAELAKISKSFSEDVFCADSLPGFQKVLNEQQPVNNDILSDIKPLNNKYQACNLLPKCEWSDAEYDNELVQVTEIAERLVKENSPFNAQELEVKIQTQLEHARKMNEHTPSRKPRKAPVERPIKEHGGVRRRLVNDNAQPKRKYNMKALYESLTGKELLDAHRAEVDTMALLECVTAVGLPILEWMDKNRVPFRSIKKMW